MTKREIVLAALAAADGELHSPVQVQKLLFLIDREIPELVNGPHFNFHPYNYGPFDQGVYAQLDRLEAEGDVEIVPQMNWQAYRLTPKGQSVGKTLLNGLHATARKYIHSASEFVRAHTFAALVSAIYKAYPEMRANSVFRS